MKDKLYKTNRKVGFYRLRSTIFGVLFLAMTVTAFTLPYKYVVKAINESQEPAAGSEVEELVVEEIPKIEVKLI